MDSANQLLHDMSDAENHTSQIESNVKAIDSDLKSVDQDLLISKKINTNLKDLNSALVEANELLEIVSIIPEIGAEASEMKDAVVALQTPVSDALAASNKVESVVGPARTKIEQVEKKVAQLDTELLKLMNAENQFITVLGDAIHCINALPAGDVKNNLTSGLDTPCGAVIPIVTNFDKVQVDILNTINSAKSELDGIMGTVSSLVSINNSIDAVLNVLNPLMSGLNSVKNALNHTIRIPYGGYPKICKKWGVPYPCGWHTVYFSFSVEQIIKGGLSVIGPVEDLLNKAMNAFLKPILNALHLNFNLPGIPGLGNLTKLATSLGAPLTAVENALDGLVGNLSAFEDAYNQFQKYEAELANVNKECLTNHSS